MTALFSIIVLCLLFFQLITAGQGSAMYYASTAPAAGADATPKERCYGTCAGAAAGCAAGSTACYFVPMGSLPTLIVGFAVAGVVSCGTFILTAAAVTTCLSNRRKNDEAAARSRRGGFPAPAEAHPSAFSGKGHTLSGDAVEGPTAVCEHCQKTIPEAALTAHQARCGPKEN